MSAEKGLWREPTVGMDSSDAGQIAKSAVESAWQSMMGPGVPMWFSRAADAAKRVLQADEMLGLECVAALMAAVDRAEPEHRPAALELLLGVLEPPSGGMSFGLL